MRGAEGVAVVDEGWVDEVALFRPIEQGGEEAEVPVTAANAVPSAVLVQNKQLARTEPPLQRRQREGGQETEVTATNAKSAVLVQKQKQTTGPD